MKDILLATSYFGQILKEIGAFYLFIPSTILSMIAGILFYYLCISIGNLFNTNKVLMGFVAFFAIQAILFFIGFFFGLGAALTGDATYTAINNPSYIISLVQSLILDRSKLLWYLLHHDQTLKFRLKKNLFLLEHDFFALKRLIYFVLYDKSRFRPCYPKRSVLDVVQPFLVYQQNSHVGLDHKPSRLSYVPRLGLE